MTSFLIMSEYEIVSYKTPYIVGDNLFEVLKSLEELSDIIFK